MSLQVHLFRLKSQWAVGDSIVIAIVVNTFHCEHLVHLNQSNWRHPRWLSLLPLRATIVSSLPGLRPNNASDGVTVPGVVSEVHYTSIYGQPTVKYDAFVDVTKWVTPSFWTLEPQLAALWHSFKTITRIASIPGNYPEVDPYKRVTCLT